MPDFTLDWTAVNIDGSNTLTSGSDTIGVGISTPTNGDGDDWAIGNIAGSPALRSSHVDEDTTVTATFDNPVENVEFEIFDVDSGSGWDDQITVIALNAAGEQVTVNFSDLFMHTVSGNTIEGSGNDNPGVEGSGAPDSVTVSIPGPIVSLTIVHDNGSDVSNSGTVGLGSLGFDAVATPPGPVDGLGSGEVMGPGYTDLQGDEIDGSDGDDDTIFGNGGDDTIDSGAGDDTVDGGSGDDTFVLTDGIDNDVLEGDDTGETVGDRLDATAITADTTLDFSGDEEGTLTDGAGTTTFAEIESFSLGSGDDTVIGNDGDDSVDGGAGDDTMTGGDGEDTLAGGDGEDTIDGGAGDDTLMGGGDDDTIIGGDGSDTVIDMEGDNTIDTGRTGALPDIGYPGVYTADTDPNDDRDSVTTGSGDDNISTGDDADTIIANGGNDTIDAGFDDDEVDGGSGDDYIIGGEGNDSIFGNGGNDVIYGGSGPGVPDVTNIPDDGSGPFGPDLVTDNGMDTIDGGNGNDMIFGEDDDDLLIGGNGADTLDGGVDDDTLLGGVGQDDLIGGQGMDSMSGGDDRDEFIINEREHAFGDTIDGGTGGNDVDTLDLNGLGRFEIVGETVDADGDSTSGTVNFLDADGNIEGTLVFSEVERLIICFTPGSRIATPKGEIMVQDLQAGDRVITRDDGVQDIQWIGRKKLGAGDLIADPQLRPVLIKAGSLGNGLPERDMMVSPNHRMLMANATTQVLFDEREVLVAAKHLVGRPGIQQIDSLGTEYIHVMFERHQVILGDGAWTESFQPGDHSLSGIDGEQRDEIFKLFPSLQKTEGRRAYSSARQSLKAHEARMLRESMAD